MTSGNWTITTEPGPVIATAIHTGHDLRTNIVPQIALDDASRLREEDPYTDRWIGIGDSTIAVGMSRFEVDLNRPRETAVYRTPEEAWGLEVWKSAPGDDVVEASLAEYDRFYADLGELCDGVAEEHERFLILDIHSYNHRRGGPDAPVDPPEDNPEINVGTGSVTDPAWRPLIDAFSAGVDDAPFDGGTLDVRENVRFRGGHMSRWLNARYEGRGCALAIEVKKIYMDEWTGEPYEGMIASVDDGLRAGVIAAREALGS